MVGYDDLRREQAEKRAEGELMGIGIASFTEVVGAGHGKDFDILGLKMFDSAELRVHPTGKAILKLGVKAQGQGHETTFAQIVAEELGIPAKTSRSMEGDTDNTPYGLGTYASRSDPGRRRRHGGGRRASSATRPARSPRTCSRRPTTTSSGSPAASTSRAPRQRRHDPGRRLRRLHATSPRAWSPASRACTTTTRRT